MQVDFARPFVSIDGEAMTTTKKGDVNATLKSVCVEALLSFNPADNSTKGAAKAKRYELAMLINSNGGMVEVEAEDIALMKKLVGEVFPPIVVGQAYRFLECKPDAEAEIAK